MQYQFYRALEHASQDKMYQICGQEVIRSCLDGYNGTIMAYGQTGAGKTYTMYGDEDVGFQDVDYHGIMPRAIHDVQNAAGPWCANLRFRSSAAFRGVWNGRLK